MGADLRITVIATGFDRHLRMDGEARRKTVMLNVDTPAVSYKGEENLKRLDPPAYTRREATVTVDASNEDHSEEVRGVRRLNAEEIQSTERILKGDTDVPAFLRKMMD
jgi:cell division protein FtsZ